DGSIKAGILCKVETGTDFKLPESARNTGLVDKTTSDLKFRQMMARSRTVYKLIDGKWEKIEGEFHSKDVIFVEGKGIIGELTGFERVNKFREFTLRNEAEFIDVEGAKAYKLTAENLAQGLREIPKEMMDLGSEIVKDSTLPEATKKRLVEELQNIAATMEGGEVLQSSLRGGEGIKTRQKLLEEARQAQAKIREARDKLKESGAYEELPKEFRELIDSVAERSIKESDLLLKGGRKGELNSITPHERLKQISEFYSEKEITKDYEEFRRAPAQMLTTAKALVEAVVPPTVKPTLEVPAPLEVMVRGEVKAVEYMPEQRGFVTPEGEFAKPKDLTARSFNRFREERKEDAGVLIPVMQDRYEVPSIIKDRDTGAYYEAVRVDDQFILTDVEGKTYSLGLDEIVNYKALTSAAEVKVALETFEVEAMVKTATKLRNKITEDNIGESKE
ncbi:unnamed protein product, partial [marine sediment metagenome]